MIPRRFPAAQQDTYTMLVTAEAKIWNSLAAYAIIEALPGEV
jgi:uncharacterized protein YbaA (DUF1428 family)